MFNVNQGLLPVITAVPAAAQQPAAESAAPAAQQHSILIATSGTINYANIALAELFFNYGVCLMEASKYEKALHAVMQSKQLILPFGAETKMLGDRVKLLEEILTSRLYMSIPSIDMVKHNQDHKQVRKMKKIRKKNL